MLVMGILNLTPDSFSDGGQFTDPERAVAHAQQLTDHGAAIIDVGGESTRPGAARVDEAEELGRVIPVIEELAARGITISVDTMRARVARAAVEAGASIVNDISGGQADDLMLPTVAELEVDYILMHWRAHSATMQEQATYDDVVSDVLAEIAQQRDRAVAAGIEPGRIIVDPGIGFSKTFEHNWSLLHHLGRFSDLGHRMLVGASRKGFLAEELALDSTAQRDAATAAITAIAAREGAWAVRTHEVATQVTAAAVGERIRRG